MIRYGFLTAILIIALSLLSPLIFIPRKQEKPAAQRFCVHELLGGAYPCEWVPAEYDV